MTKNSYQFKIVIEIMLLVCLVLLLSSDHISAAANWVEVTSIGATKGWYGIASSADGTKLAAVVDGQNIWTSNNTGATWTEDTSVGEYKDWHGITSSAHGTKLAAVVYGEHMDVQQHRYDLDGRYLRWCDKKMVWYHLLSRRDEVGGDCGI